MGTLSCVRIMARPEAEEKAEARAAEAGTAAAARAEAARVSDGEAAARLAEELRKADSGEGLVPSGLVMEVTEKAKRDNEALSATLHKKRSEVSALRKMLESAGLDPDEALKAMEDEAVGEGAGGQ